MAPPASSARALHDLIAALDGRVSASDRSSYHAWIAHSGEQIESAGFARFHAEALALFRDVVEAVQTLDPDARERYVSYFPKWWDALVRPRQDWAAENQKIVEPPALHMLGALADVLETRARFGGGLPGWQATDVLSSAVALLLGEIEAATELPPAVRDQIVADMRHVLWLLENVGVFGVEHTVAAVEQVTGKAVAEAAKSPMVLLKRVAVGLTAALALAATITGSVDTIAANVRSTFGIEAAGPAGEDVVQNTVVEIYNACTTRELTAGPAATGGGEPVHAEVVGEDAQSHPG